MIHKNSIKSIQVMCNNQFEKYTEYVLENINATDYVSPKNTSIRTETEFSYHIDEVSEEHVHNLIEDATYAVIQLQNIRDTYISVNESIVNFKNWKNELRESVSTQILDFVNSYGQLGFFFHILYDYITPNLPISEDYFLPLAYNPFYFRIPNAKSTNNSIVAHTFNENDLINTFFPDFKFDQSTLELEDALGVDIAYLDLTEISAQGDYLMLQYKEPLENYLAAIELFHSILTDNENNLEHISPQIKQDGNFRVRPEITLEFSKIQHRYLTNLNFKSLFEFLMFVIAAAEVDGESIIRVCGYKKCRKFYLVDETNKTVKKYCNTKCKKDAANHRRNHPEEYESN